MIKQSIIYKNIVNTYYDLQRSWSSSLPPPRCARIENNKCVLWRLIKLCDRETHIHILPTFWGLSPNFTTWYISTFWVDWDRIFPRTRKKSSGKIYVLGVKVFLYTRVLGASVKPTHTHTHTHTNLIFAKTTFKMISNNMREYMFKRLSRKKTRIRLT